MATRFYFHNSTDSTTGLPATEQSAIDATTNIGAQATNHVMNTTIGVSQTSIGGSSAASASAQRLYFTKFVSPPIYNTTIDANTWIYSFGTKESSASANFPVSSNNKAVYVNCYVWHPTGPSKVGTILDGDSAATVDEGTYNNQIGHIVNFTGAQVSGITAGTDVIIMEIWFRVTQAAATAYTDTFYYDGTTPVAADNDIFTNIASYIETPQTIAFAPLVVDCVVTSKKLLENLVKI